VAISLLARGAFGKVEEGLKVATEELFSETVAGEAFAAVLFEA
jgi:hypothetical protein